MKQGSGLRLQGIAIAIVIALTLCAGMGFGQQPAQLSPEQALGNLDRASAAYRGTREEHIAIQASLQTLGAVVKAYEQYAGSGLRVQGSAEKAVAPADNIGPVGVVPLKKDKATKK